MGKGAKNPKVGKDTEVYCFWCDEKVGSRTVQNKISVFGKDCSK